MWTNAFRAYEGKFSELIPPGPRSRKTVHSLHGVSSTYCPKRDQFAFWRPESSSLRVGVGHQPRAMEDSRASSKRSASAGRRRSPFCKLGQPKTWRPSRRPAEAGNQGDDRGIWVVILLPAKICANCLLLTRSTSSRCISQTKIEEIGCSRGGESW